MEPIIQTFKIIGTNEQKLVKLMLIQRQNPNSNMVVSGIHNTGTRTHTSRSFRSQLILHRRNKDTVLILGSPYINTSYYASGAKDYSLKKHPSPSIHLIRFHDYGFNFEEQESSDFLWVQIGSITSCEVQYIPQNNKDAANKLLLKLEQD